MNGVYLMRFLNVIANKIAMLFSLLLLIPCTSNAELCNSYIFGIPKQAIVDFGNVDVSTNIAVGSIVKTYNLGELYDGTVMFFCSNMPIPPGISLFSGELGTITYNGTKYIDIGIEGLALQMRNNSNDSRGGLWSFPASMSVAGNVIYEKFNNTNSHTLYIRSLGSWSFHLIKTAKFVYPGVSTGGIIAKFAHSDGGNITGINELGSFYFKPITVTAPTCTIESYDKTVFMGKVTTSKLNTLGATSNATSFQIRMYCQSTNLSPTLSFEGDTDTNLGVFKNITGGTYASGVGVRLAYGGKYITPGTPVSLKVPHTSTADYNFSASYVRTGDLVSGTIEVPVTFTLSYE